jgi:hypothetical protein
MENRLNFSEKVRLLMARRPGLSFGEAQCAVKRADAAQAQAEAEAVTLAARGKTFVAAQTAKASTPQTSFRLRARQIQLERGCDLGAAQLLAAKERQAAPATPTPIRAPAQPAPGAPLPLAARGKTQLLSARANEDDGEVFLMVSRPLLARSGAN